jgi:hypothetical protein
MLALPSVGAGFEVTPGYHILSHPIPSRPILIRQNTKKALSQPLSILHLSPLHPLYFLNVLSLTFLILLADTPLSPDCFALMLASFSNLLSVSQISLLHHHHPPSPSFHRPVIIRTLA